MAKKIVLSKAEMETIINFDRELDTAQIYTADKVMMNKLDKLCKAAPENYKLIREDEVSKTYVFPKNLISLRKPMRKRNLTDEERKNIGERLNNSQK